MTAEPVKKHICLSHTWPVRKEQQRAMWEAMQRALGLICAACGDQTGPFEFDHIDPATKRRSSRRESYRARLYEIRRLMGLGQIQLLCGPCNLSKSCRYIDYRPRGHMARGLLELADQAKFLQQMRDDALAEEREQVMKRLDEAVAAAMVHESWPVTELGQLIIGGDPAPVGDPF